MNDEITFHALPCSSFRDAARMAATRGLHAAMLRDGRIVALPTEDLDRLLYADLVACTIHHLATGQITTVPID